MRCQLTFAYLYTIVTAAVKVSDAKYFSFLFFFHVAHFGNAYVHGKNIHLKISYTQINNSGTRLVVLPPLLPSRGALNIIRYF